MARTSYAGFATVAAGTREDVLERTVERTQEFLLREVEVQSASSPNGTLETRVFAGDRPVAPQQGPATLVTEDTLLDAETAYQRGDTIRVLVENTGTSARDLSVIARGISTADLDGSGYTTFFEDDV